MRRRGPRAFFVGGADIIETRYFITSDGCRIAWRFDGGEDAPVLLLSNSLGTDMTMWDPQVAEWTNYFRVLRYDSRGHGASASPAGAYSMDRLGLDAVELLNKLAIPKVHFCGLSKGGMIGQWLALRASDRLDRLVLANTSAYIGPPSNWKMRIDAVLDQGVAPLADASIQRWFTAAFIQQNFQDVMSVKAMLLANNPVGYSGCCAAIRDLDFRPYLRLVRTPTLVIGGTMDSATPPPHSEFLASEINGAQLVMLEAAHLANVERPMEFSTSVADFLLNSDSRAHPSSSTIVSLIPPV